jgi:hypothetical protein
MVIEAGQSNKIKLIRLPVESGQVNRLGLAGISSSRTISVTYSGPRASRIAIILTLRMVYGVGDIIQKCALKEKEKPLLGS